MARQLVLAILLVATISGCGGAPTNDDKAIEGRCQAAMTELGVTGSVMGWMDNVTPEQRSETGGLGTVCVVGPDAQQLFVPRNGPPVSLPPLDPTP